MRSFILYCLVGIVNTCIGFSIIFSLTFFGIIPELANLLGYCLGIACSFFFNNAITFSEQNIKKIQGLLRFIIAMGISFFFNFCVLFVCHRLLEIDVYIAQALAGMTYALCGFILSKLFVWKEERID